ncbi:MAG: aminotransferase class IV, partial [Thermoleophilia bacterium]|nr:aminotransferase class IV [Thermoleophilia bacterium]
MYVYLNGHLVPDKDATVSVFDRGFTYGDSLIETLKILHGQPVFFKDHFNRLCRAMEQAGFEAKLDGGNLRNHAVSLAEANLVADGRLRLQLSRGVPESPGGVDPGGRLTPTLLITAEQFAGYPEEEYQKGALCVTVAANRGRYAAIKS